MLKQKIKSIINNISIRISGNIIYKGNISKDNETLTTNTIPIDKIMLRPTFDNWLYRFSVSNLVTDKHKSLKERSNEYLAEIEYLNNQRRLSKNNKQVNIKWLN